MMKLLVTTGDVSNRMSPSNFIFLLDELAKLTDLTVWYQPGDIHEIIGYLGIQPDIIFINEFGERKAPVITGLGSLTIPYAVYLHDLHYQINQRKEAINHNNVPYIFTHYRDKFLEWLPEFRDKMRWLPHHANTNVFKDYGLTKDIDWLLMGSAGDNVYPLRRKIIDTMQNRQGFMYHIYAGHNNPESVLVGEAFSRQINRAKIFLTCDSIYHYPVRKYFEVLASKTLLLAPSSPELRDLGFISGFHFVGIDEEDFAEIAEYYLHHEQERLFIAEQGYKMVHTNHSTVQRAAQLTAMLEDILQSRAHNAT